MTFTGPGVYRIDDEVAEAVAAATAHGLTPYVVAEQSSKAGFLDAVATALSFPDWFGRNLDALADSVGDLSWLPPGPLALVWERPAALGAADPATDAAVREILTQAAEESRDGPRPLTVLLTDR